MKRRRPQISTTIRAPLVALSIGLFAVLGSAQADTVEALNFDIEEALSLLGYDPGAIDGVIDGRTKRALKALIAASEGVFPEEDPAGLLEALQVLMQDAVDFPEDRNWGKKADLNRKLAAATGYLGSFAGRGFTKWVDRQPRSSGISKTVREIKKTKATTAPTKTDTALTASRLQVLETLDAPIAPLHLCDKLAADQFDENAQSNGVGLWDIDTAQAITMCMTALETAPNEARFAFQLARAQLAAGQGDLARPVFTALAGEGHMPSIAHLGYLDYLGQDGDGSLTSARKYLTLAADHSELALVILVDMLRTGDGGDKDPAEAVRWLKIGVDRRSDPANLRALADMYANGEGVDKDLAKAETLQKLARGETTPSPIEPLSLDREPLETEYSTPSPTVIVSDSILAPQTAPQISFAGLPETGQHWLAVSAPGLPGKEYYFLKMLDLGQTDGTITGPELPVGVFEARLFLNWPEGKYQITDVAPIEVIVDHQIVLRRRQLVIELEKLLSGADLPELQGAIKAARTGKASAAEALANALILKAKQYALVSAELTEVAPLLMALDLVRYSVELTPQNSGIIRAAGLFYLLAPVDADLIYEAENLLSYAVELDADDRLARRYWIEALARLTRYDAAQQQLATLWPPHKDEPRLVGLVSELYSAQGKPKEGLKLLEGDLPKELQDTADLARAVLEFEAGDKDAAVELVQVLAESSDPYFAAIGRNMTPVQGPAAPLKLPDN